MLKRHRILLAILALSSLAFLATHPLPEKSFLPTEDEGFYYRYARSIHENGVAGFRDTLDSHARDTTVWEYPPPYRIGHTLINVFAFKLLGAHYTTLGSVSFLCFLLFVGISFYYAKKHFGIDRALLLSLFLSSSPLLLAMSRRALSESAINLFWGLSVWLFFDFLMCKKKHTYILFLLSLAYALTIKETTIFLIPFFIAAGIVYKNTRWPEMNKAYLIGIGLWAGLVGMLMIACIALGGGTGNAYGTLRSVFQYYASAASTHRYASLFQSGPWFRHLIDFMLLTPITTLLFIGYTYRLLIKSKFRWDHGYFLLYSFITYGLLSVLPHSKNIRLTINFELVIHLFAVFALYDLLRADDCAARTKIVLYVAIIIALLNFHSFLRIFYLGGVYDPISYHLLTMRNFIPRF